MWEQYSWELLLVAFMVAAIVAMYTETKGHF